jgi:hypothetical protein
LTDEKHARLRARNEDSPSFADDPMVRELLSRLDHLERQTNPQREGSENDKDAAAHKAMNLASELAAYVAGWAVSHKIGLAAEGHGNIPDLIPSARTAPYNELRENVDSHRHEAAGRQPVIFASAVKRRALANLLRFNLGGLDESLRGALAEALEALDYGETLELLKPEKDGSKRQLRELKLQLWGLCCVEYMHTMGRKKYELLKCAADAFGVSENTMRNWEYRLREWNVHAVANGLSRARHCGEIDRARGTLDFDYIWGLSALEKYGTEYKSLLRSKSA